MSSTLTKEEKNIFRSSDVLRKKVAQAQANIAAELTGNLTINKDWKFVRQAIGGVELTQSLTGSPYSKILTQADVVNLLQKADLSLSNDISLIKKAIRGMENSPSGLVLYHGGRFVRKDISKARSKLVANPNYNIGRPIRLTPAWESMFSNLRESIIKNVDMPVDAKTGKPAANIARVANQLWGEKVIPLHEYLGLTGRRNILMENIDSILDPNSTHIPSTWNSGGFIKNASLNPRVADYYKDLSKYPDRYDFKPSKETSFSGGFRRFEEAERIAAFKTEEVVTGPPAEADWEEHRKYSQEEPSVLKEGKGKDKKFTLLKGGDVAKVTSATPESQLTGLAGGQGSFVTETTQPVKNISGVDLDKSLEAIDVKATSAQRKQLLQYGISGSNSPSLSQSEAKELLKEARKQEQILNRSVNYPLLKPSKVGGKTAQRRQSEPVSTRHPVTGEITTKQFKRGKPTIWIPARGMNKQVAQELMRHGATFDGRNWTIKHVSYLRHKDMWNNLIKGLGGKINAPKVFSHKVDLGKVDDLGVQTVKTRTGFGRRLLDLETKYIPKEALSDDDPFGWRKMASDPRDIGPQTGSYGKGVETSDIDLRTSSKPTTIQISKESAERARLKKQIKLPLLTRSFEWIKAKKKETPSSFFRDVAEDEMEGVPSKQRTSMKADNRARKLYEGGAVTSKAANFETLFKQESAFDRALAKVRKSKNVKMLLPALLLAGVFGTIMGNERNAA